MKIAKNILALGIGQLFTWGSSAVLVWLLPHYLTSDDYGRFGVGYTLISFIGPFADLGASTHLLRETASGDHANARAWLGDSLGLRIPLLSLSSVAGVLVMFAIIGDERARLLFLILLPSLIFATLSASIGATLRGLQDMAPCALSDALGRGTSLALTVVLLMKGFGPVGVAVAADIGGFISLVVIFVAMVRNVGVPGPLKPARWRSLMTTGFPFFIAGAAVAFHGRIDMLILSHLSDLTVTGWYNVAYSIITIPVFIPSIIVGAFYPAISHAARTDPEATGRLTRRCLQLVLMGTLPLAFGISILSGQIIHVLGYHSDFSHAAPLIAILSLNIPVASANMVIATTVFALGGEKRFMAVMIAATVLDVALNFAFVPMAQSAWGNGAVASAIITVSTEVFILPFGLRLLPREVLGREGYMQAGYCILAAELMALAVMPFRDQFIAIPILIGGVSYAIAVIALGIISMRELMALPRYLQNRSIRQVPLPSSEAPAGAIAGS